MPLLFHFPFLSSGRSRHVPAGARLTVLGLGCLLFFAHTLLAFSSHHGSVTAYARAATIERHLEMQPVGERTRGDYERALNAYRAVYHSDPASPDAVRSIAAVADLLASEGRCFRDEKLFRDAVAQWEFLRRQYPTSSLRQRALLEEAQIEQHDLHDRTAARKIYRSFLAHYPQDTLAEQARAELHGDAAIEAEDRTPVPYRTSPRRTDASFHPEETVSARQAIPQKPRASVVEEPQQVAHSDVVFPAVVKSSETNSRSAAVRARQETLLPVATSSAKSLPKATIQNVRYWAQGDSTRLAVDLSDQVPYRTYSGRDGRQITLIFFGAHSAAALLDSTIAAAHDANLHSIHVSMLTGNQAALVLELNRAVSFSSFILSNPARLIMDLHPEPAIEVARSGTHSIARNLPATRTQGKPPAGIPAGAQAAAGGKNLVGAADSAQSFPDMQAPAFPAEPAVSSQHSMTRVLGLHVRRIVIDAGHGGHDSGTVGPDGLEEKDVALDVALRLGHLLRQRLGAEVVYTRRSDKYVSLEERTAIANEAHADLFLSIHANSSSDPQIRGVETYFLNFTSSPGAMAVAARENADSNRSVHELSDLVRKIALSDKIDESREFAGDVQQELYVGMAPSNPGFKNRGVKQAPFAVLIGARMPSILAEISFLTNSESDMELRQPAYRERLAESLYRGVAEYVQGMSGVRVAKTMAAEVLPAPAE